MHRIHLLPCCRRLLWAVLWVLALAACGGGGSPAPQEAADSATAQVGAEGGVLRAGALSLELPPGALSETTTLSLLAFAPEPGELARYRLAPAGLRLQKPAVLRLLAAGLPNDAQLYWQVDGDNVLLPFSQQGGEWVVQIRHLGFTSGGGVLDRVQANALRGADSHERLMPQAAADSGDLVVQLRNCPRDVGRLKSRLRNAAQLRQFERAQAIYDELLALQAQCDDLEIAALSAEACGGLQDAVNQAVATPARRFEDVQGHVVPLLAAMAFVQKTGETCNGLLEQANALVPEVFDQFLDTLMAGVRDGSLFEDAGPRELSQIMGYEAHCQLLALDAVCDRFGAEIYPTLLDRLRQAAFDECRQNNSTLVMSQFHAMGVRFGNDEKFYDHGRFSVADVRHDISYCTDPQLNLRVFDDALDTPVELTDQRQTLRPGATLGNYVPATTVQVPADGSLLVTGQFRGQRCETGESLAADLVVRLSTIEVTRIPLSGGNYNLNNPPLDLVISRLYAQTGLSPEVTRFTLGFHLEGGGCVLETSEGPRTVLNQRETLFEINVQLPELPPEPGLFKGPVLLTLESDNPGFVRLTETLVSHESVTLSGEFEQLGPLSFRIRNARMSVNGAYQVTDRRAAITGNCSYTRVVEQRSTINVVRDLEEVFIVSGVEIHRDERNIRLTSVNVVWPPLALHVVETTRFENAQGDCSAQDFTERSVVTDTTNNFFNASFAVLDADGRPVVNVPIEGSEETGLSASVNAGANLTGNNGSYRRTSVSMQLRDRPAP
jgi:hypothetical protein